MRTHIPGAVASGAVAARPPDAAAEINLVRSDPVRAPTVLIATAWIQGVYYVATGFWPIVDIDSFQLVTGPKTDLWLVRTVGVLVAVIGAVLLVDARCGRVGAVVVLMAVGRALDLAAIETVYALA